MLTVNKLLDLFQKYGDPSGVYISEPDSESRTVIDGTFCLDQIVYALNSEAECRSLSQP